MEKFKEQLRKDYELNSDYRYDAVYKISTLLARHKQFATDLEHLVSSSVDIEKAIYNKCYKEINPLYRSWDFIEFEDYYCDEIRHILTNIDQKSHVANKDIIKLLKVKSLQEICNMSVYDIHPTLWDPIFEDMRKQEEAKNYEGTNTGMRCRRCGSRDLFISQSQTRSADEGSTIMTTCNNCGNVKKS
jgi:DNA-directed RNA polymerase subunit M/transcription elongation factor TFIIS